MNDGTVDSGVSHGAELLAFTDAVMARDASAIAKTRDALEQQLGKDGVVEAAAVITMFNVVDRIADSTGIPIDDGFTRDMRYGIGSELGMDHLSPEERASR
ncbi:MAG: putative homoserine dehydrogenase-like protein [Myxococcota bacterium]